jgi:hypothetical protein
LRIPSEYSECSVKNNRNNQMKKALITGITGQDGAYLAGVVIEERL